MKINSSSSFVQLLLMNLRLIYRNRTGVFFSVVMPSIIYVVLSLLPVNKILNIGINYTEFVLPGIIAMTVMQGGIYGLSYWMIDLRSRGVIKRFLVTPIKNSELVISTLVSRLALAMAQVVFLTLLGLLIFRTPLSWNLLLAIPVILLGATIFLLIGLLIANYADTVESAAPIITAVGLPLTFFGNIFFPVQSLPGFLGLIGKALPITYFADATRSIFLNTYTWTSLSQDVGILLVWLVVILSLALWRFRLEE